jgi:hypothetical protein
MNRVKEIYAEIEKLNDELEDIRKKCTHEEYHIAYYMWRIGSTIISRICLECGENLGTPSTEEIREFKAEENNGQGIKVYKGGKDFVKINPYQID